MSAVHQTAEEVMVMTNNDNRLLIERLERRIEQQGTTARQVSMKAGLGATALNDIMSGRNKRPGLAVIKAIATVLECDISYLLGDQDTLKNNQPSPIEEIPVIGTAEAGAFRQMQVYPQEEGEPPTITANRSILYPRAKHFALLVRGDSMNKARPTPIIDGVHILCVDLVDAGIEIESGKIYAVRRTIDAGATYEWTVKRAMVYRDRYELLPESSNPAHEAFVIKRDKPPQEDGVEIAAIGLVYGLFLSFENQAS